MQAQQFSRKRQAGSPAQALNERAGAQADFIDLCRAMALDSDFHSYRRPRHKEIALLRPD